MFSVAFAIRRHPPSRASHARRVSGLSIFSLLPTGSPLHSAPHALGHHWMLRQGSLRRPTLLRRVRYKLACDVRCVGGDRTLPLAASCPKGHLATSPQCVSGSCVLWTSSGEEGITVHHICMRGKYSALCVIVVIVVSVARIIATARAQTQRGARSSAWRYCKAWRHGRSPTLLH